MQMFYTTMRCDVADFDLECLFQLYPFLDYIFKPLWMQGSEDSTSDYVTPEIKGDFETTQGPLTAPQTSYSQHGCRQSSHNLQDQSDTCSEMHACMSCDSSEDAPGEINLVPNLTGCGPSSCFQKSKNKSNNPLAGVKQYSKWGHIHVSTPCCVCSSSFCGLCIWSFCAYSFVGFTLIACYQNIFWP